MTFESTVVQWGLCVCVHIVVLLLVCAVVTVTVLEALRFLCTAYPETCVLHTCTNAMAPPAYPLPLATGNLPSCPPSPCLLSFRSPCLPVCPSNCLSVVLSSTWVSSLRCCAEMELVEGVKYWGCNEEIGEGNK